jgi:hypothetical protein
MEIRHSLISQFVEALKCASEWPVDLPDFQARIPNSGDRADALVHFGNTLVVIEAKSEGYPRDARESIFRLQEFVQKLESHEDTAVDVLPLFVSERVTEGARQLLRRHHVGYFDASGSLHLEAPPRLMLHIDRPPTKPAKRKAQSIFSGAREQILLALFNALPAWRDKHPDDGWLPFNDILIASKTAKSTLSEMLQELEKREYVAVRGDGRTRAWRLKQPGPLLDEWADAMSNRKESKSRWYRFEQAPDELLPKLLDELRDHHEQIAVTGAAAAQLYSPWLTSLGTVDLIVPPGTREDVANRLGLSKADKGANVTLIERSGASTLHKRLVPGNPSLPAVLANPFIAYLDTVGGPGRQKELAMQLRTSVLKV